MDFKTFFSVGYIEFGGNVSVHFSLSFGGGSKLYKWRRRVGACIIIMEIYSKSDQSF